MKKPGEAPAQRKVLRVPVRQHAGPRQSEWRNLVRRLAKNPLGS